MSEFKHERSDDYPVKHYALIKGGWVSIRKAYEIASELLSAAKLAAKIAEARKAPEEQVRVWLCEHSSSYDLWSDIARLALDNKWDEALALIKAS